MKLHGAMEGCYNVQMSVDSKNKMVMDFEVTNHAQDKNQLGSMAEKAKEAFEVKELTAIADAGYDSASDIVFCIENGITPHVAHIAGGDIDVCMETDEAHAQRVASYENGRCVYYPKRNIAICPMGHVLYPVFFKNRAGAALFYNGKACSQCTQKCTSYRYKAFELVMKKSEFHKEYDDSNLFIRQSKIISDK